MTLHELPSPRVIFDEEYKELIFMWRSSRYVIDLGIPIEDSEGEPSVSIVDHVEDAGFGNDMSLPSDDFFVECPRAIKILTNPKTEWVIPGSAQSK